MAILVTDNFKDDEINLKVLNDQEYINDDIVTAYWHDLARSYSIPTENLPDSADISALVRLYLVNEVGITVCNDNIGANIIEMSQGITVDQWELKLNTLTTNKSRLLSLMSASDIYDPDNVPDDNITSSSSIIRYNEYPSE